MKTSFEFSWYLHQPKGGQLSVCIGPIGNGNHEWKELGPVETPPDRWTNGFYMEAELACVMRRHGWSKHCDSRTPAKATKLEIYYGNISYEVPGHPLCSNETLTKE